MSVSEATPSGVSRRRRWAILAALWTFVITVLLAFRSVVVFFAGAALIAYLVAPLVNKLTQIRIARRPLPRWAAILIIYAAFFLLLYLAVLGLVPQLYRELARIIKGVIESLNGLTHERIAQLVSEAEMWLAARGLPLELTPRTADAGGLTLDLAQALHDVVDHATAVVRDNVAGIIGFSRNVVAGLLAGAFMSFFILMVAAYLSIDAARIRAYARELIPAEL
ncbi:MAG: AI-2E family transporter, partial [Myxococcaceae bacterium]